MLRGGIPPGRPAEGAAPLGVGARARAAANEEGLRAGPHPPSPSMLIRAGQSPTQYSVSDSGSAQLPIRSGFTCQVISALNSAQLTSSQLCQLDSTVDTTYRRYVYSELSIYARAWIRIPTPILALPAKHRDRSEAKAMRLQADYYKPGGQKGGWGWGALKV